MSFLKPPCIEGSGTGASETRPVAAFNSVNLETEAEVTIVQGTPQNLEVSADDNILPLITTEVSNETLTIAETSCYTTSLGVKVAATIPTIDAIKVGTSGSVTGSNLSLQNPSVSTSSSGSINLSDITASAVTAKVSGSGDITLTGTADSISINISSSGNITADECTTGAGTVTVSASGDARVYATDTLHVTISGSGNVYYRGNPTVQQNISGSCKLIHID